MYLCVSFFLLLLLLLYINVCEAMRIKWCGSNMANTIRLCTCTYITVMLRFCVYIKCAVRSLPPAPASMVHMEHKFGMQKKIEVAVPSSWTLHHLFFDSSYLLLLHSMAIIIIMFVVSLVSIPLPSPLSLFFPLH